MKTTKDIIKRNRAVTLARGDSWKSKLKPGRLDAQLNPTKLKVKRVQKNISQDEMSELLSLHRSTYGAIERAKRRVTEKRANLIANKLGDTKDNLFRREKNGSLVATLA